MPSCADCGLLAIRNKQTREPSEVESQMREHWRPVENNEGRVFIGSPLCIAGAMPHDESRAMIDSEDSKEVILGVIKKERDCPCFAAWRHGLSPKEHQEMLNTAELRKQGEEQRQRDFDWQQKQRAAGRGHRSRAKAKVGRPHFSNRLGFNRWIDRVLFPWQSVAARHDVCCPLAANAVCLLTGRKEKSG